MLVLSRKANEAIVIKETIRIHVVSIKGDRVRLGIEAPRHVTIDRAEIHERRMEFIDVVLPAGDCEESVDLGGPVFAFAQHSAH